MARITPEEQAELYGNRNLGFKRALTGQGPIVQGIKNAVVTSPMWKVGQEARTRFNQYEQPVEGPLAYTPPGFLLNKAGEVRKENLYDTLASGGDSVEEQNQRALYDINQEVQPMPKGNINPLQTGADDLYQSQRTERKNGYVKPPGVDKTFNRYSKSSYTPPPEGMTMNMYGGTPVYRQGNSFSDTVAGVRYGNRGDNLTPQQEAAAGAQYASGKAPRSEQIREVRAQDKQAELDQIQKLADIQAKASGKGRGTGPSAWDVYKEKVRQKESADTRALASSKEKYGRKQTSKEEFDQLLFDLKGIDSDDEERVDKARSAMEKIALKYNPTDPNQDPNIVRAANKTVANRMNKRAWFGNPYKADRMQTRDELTPDTWLNWSNADPANQWEEMLMNKQYDFLDNR